MLQAERTFRKAVKAVLGTSSFLVYFIHLPDNNPVQKLFLLLAGTSQVDTGGFDAVMSHQIRQKGDVIEPL